MSLFDPYSHTRIFELRQEQLARKARQRALLGLDAHDGSHAHQSIPSLVHTLTSRIGRGRKATPAATRPSARPALDS